MTTILQILQHALGRDEYGRPKSPTGEDYRNHYCSGPGCDTYDLCREAVLLGLMTEHPPSDMSGGDYVYRVTPQGIEYIAQHSPKPPEPKRRHCGCPGAPRARHLNAKQRAAFGMKPCRKRGRKSGPSGKRPQGGGGLPRVRLSPKLAKEARRWEDEGRGDEAAEVLTKAREGAS